MQWEDYWQKTLFNYVLLLLLLLLLKPTNQQHHSDGYEDLQAAPVVLHLLSHLVLQLFPTHTHTHRDEEHMDGTCRCTLHPGEPMTDITWGPIEPGGPGLPLGPDWPCRDQWMSWSTAARGQLNTLEERRSKREVFKTGGHYSRRALTEPDVHSVKWFLKVETL